MQSETPLAHQVIPLIDGLNASLERFIELEDLPLVIQHGTSNAIHILNKYYARTDLSEIYALPWVRHQTIFLRFIISIKVYLVLHLRYKLQYFEPKRWPQDWIDTARLMAKEVWEKSYKQQEAVSGSHVDVNRQVSNYIFR